jgi:hypothetical protein
MGLRRTTVFADENDLAIIKSAAARRGVAEAEILRDAIHLAAMANRSWDEPFFSHRFQPSNASSSAPDVLDDVWDEKVAAYERTKHKTS